MSKVERIAKVSGITIVIFLFILSIIFFIAGDYRFKRAVKMYDLITENNLKTDKKLEKTALILKKIEDQVKIQPHTVVLLKPGKHGRWEYHDVKRFKNGQQEEFIKFLKKDK